MKCNKKAIPAFALAIAAVHVSSGYAAGETSKDPTEKGAVLLQGIVVSAPREYPVAPQSATSATKTDTPLRDIPQSVQVVPKELMKEQAVLETKDALRNVSGVSLSQGEGRRDEFYIRGFSAINDTFSDGVREDALYFRDLANIEQIEVLKGPSAVLYGRGSAGGIINRITKKPVDKPLAELALIGGSFQLRRVEADLGGPLTGQALSYRLTAAYENTGSFRNGVESERTAISPALGWRLSPATHLLLQGEFLRQDRTPDRGIPSVNGRPAEVPGSNFYGERHDFAHTEAANGRLTFNHQFSKNLTLRDVAQITDVDLDALNTRSLRIDPASPGQVKRNATYFPQTQKNYLNQLELIHKTQWGATQHTLLYGVELGKQTRDLLVRIAGAPNIDLVNPQYTAPFPVFTGPAAIDTGFTAQTAGVYVQDQIAFDKHWKALLGGRFDYFDQRQQNRKNATEQQRTDRQWSPRLGLVYQPTEMNTLYANVSRSFLPAGNALFFSGANLASLEPEIATQHEVGTKNDFLDGRITATLALYQITKENVATRDPSDPSGITLIQVGEQRSRGMEIDLAGEIQPQWKLFASYAYMDAAITRSNDFAVGNRPANIPLNSGSLWSSYHLSNGFGFGGGLFYADDRYAAENNTVTLPGYVRVDAALFYKTQHVDASLNLRNLLDKKYYEAANNNVQIGPGAPFNILLSLRFKI